MLIAICEARHKIQGNYIDQISDLYDVGYYKTAHDIFSRARDHGLATLCLSLAAQAAMKIGTTEKAAELKKKALGYCALVDSAGLDRLKESLSNIDG